MHCGVNPLCQWCQYSTLKYRFPVIMTNGSIIRHLNRLLVPPIPHTRQAKADRDNVKYNLCGI